MDLPFILETLQDNTFSFSAEVIPPRNGTSSDAIFSSIDSLSQVGFHFISVTHGAGGSLRGGTMPICHYALNQKNIVPIAHLTCRGVTREDLENTLVDHHYFGIDNILALRGDPPDGLGQIFQKVPNGFGYAYELVQLITNMNQGRYIVRKAFDKKTNYKEGIPTNFCIGVACYPEDKHGIEYLEIKKKAGAHFGITQMAYDFNILKDFLLQIKKKWPENFPILPSLHIPHSYERLLYIRDKFGVSISPNLLLRMERASKVSKEAMLKEGITWSKEMVDQLIDLKAPGVHLFIMNNILPALELKKYYS